MTKGKFKQFVTKYAQDRTAGVSIINAIQHLSTKDRINLVYTGLNYMLEHYSDSPVTVILSRLFTEEGGKILEQLKEYEYTCATIIDAYIYDIVTTADKMKDLPVVVSGSPTIQ